MRDALEQDLENSRQRRDVVSGCAMDEDRLIRFVEGPDGWVIPDLGRKLPGRGVWVAADRASIEAASRKSLFSRSARRPVRAPENLTEQTERLILERVLSRLGLERKAGHLVTGFDAVRGALSEGRVTALIESLDGSADQRRKLLAKARAQPIPVRILGLFDSREMSLALGAENVIHAALLSGRGAERWLAEVERLAGFRPLFPEDWGLSDVSR